MIRSGGVLLVLALCALSAAAAFARMPRLTMREVHADVARDLDRHFRTTVGIGVWGCRRRSREAIRCYTEFHRHKPTAICVAHYEISRRSGGVVLAFRGLDSLFGSPCRRTSGDMKPHKHRLNP